MKHKILYLQPHVFEELIEEHGTPKEAKKAALNHDEAEIYSVLDFVAAFNDETVSDQGYLIALDEEGNPYY